MEIRSKVRSQTAIPQGNSMNMMTPSEGEFDDPILRVSPFIPRLEKERMMTQQIPISNFTNLNNGFQVKFHEQV